MRPGAAPMSAVPILAAPRWSSVGKVAVLPLLIAGEPGESGEITVTYDGTGKFPGHFRKTITIRTNGKKEITRLYIEGDMMPKENK